MKISYNWLKEYVNAGPDPQYIAELLTGCGLEVEGITPYCSVKGGLKGVVIGEVLTCVKHPNSDHLSLTTVNVGGEVPLNIVCGASNVGAGQKVAVATIGTTLSFGDKEITLQKTKIRGEVSEGMICAEDELGLGTSHDGIMVLDPNAIPGTPSNKYFNIEEDFVFEIGLTPNRADAASHIGVARDLAAVMTLRNAEAGDKTGISLQLPDVSRFTTDNNNRVTSIKIIDENACPRYTGITITGIEVKESPEWLKHRLNAIGLRPINNIVDITNFVLHEVGQPLHAFDADAITGGQVIVQKLEKGTKFITLDEVERELSGQDLMICNTEGPMCIAGVFGGLRSGVTGKTKNIFLESACFDPKTIRKTSKFHVLQTDASFRFERGTDPEITVFALKRAAMLIKEIAGGEISSEIIDVYPNPLKKAVVRLTYEGMDRLIGKVIDRNVVKSILGSIGIVILSETAEMLELEIPAYKVDVTREADVVEEIIRIYGYNNIEFSSEIRTPMSIARKPDPDKVQNIISDLLCSFGFTEIMNNSLTKSAYYENNDSFPAEQLVRILNPLSRDLDVLRQTLIYGGLETITYNQNRKISDLKLFEFGKAYSGKYTEERHLALFITGRSFRENWKASVEKADPFDLKGVVLAVLQKSGYNTFLLDCIPFSSEIIKDGIAYKTGQRTLVTIGTIAKAVLKQMDCRQDVFYADFNWDVLLETIPVKDLQFRDLPKYPEVRRDLALLIEKSVTYAEIEKLAFSTEKKLLKKVGLFDVYEGEKIGEGKRSYALSFILQDDQKTLTDHEIDKVMNRLIQAFSERLNALIR